MVYRASSSTAFSSQSRTIRTGWPSPGAYSASAVSAAVADEGRAMARFLSGENDRVRVAASPA